MRAAQDGGEDQDVCLEAVDMRVACALCGSIDMLQGTIDLHISDPRVFAGCL